MRIMRRSEYHDITKIRIFCHKDDECMLSSIFGYDISDGGTSGFGLMTYLRERCMLSIIDE